MALSVTTISATIAMGFLVVRYTEARTRETARRDQRDFEERIEDFLSGSLRGRELLREAAKLEATIFWAAIGSLHRPPLSRSRRDLEQVLRYSRHVGAERRALHDASPVRRELAARRLADAGASRAKRSLRRVMVAGPEPVTLAAAAALARLRDGGALRWLLAHPDRLVHRSPRARYALLRAFGRGAQPLLLESLSGEPGEPRMERALIDTLASFRCVEAAPAIAKRLAHEWRDVRLAAARALGVLASREHRDAIVARLHDEDWRVRAQAARALGRLEARESIAELRGALSDPSWWVRRHAAYALLELGDEGLAVLREAEQGHADRYARDIASEALSGRFSRAS